MTAQSMIFANHQTASTAYQAMLKQYSGMHQVEDESEDDDFEEIFSGDGTEKYFLIKLINTLD